ncbi:MAG: Glu/Leu/Phe/Val family dehydrogenase [Bacilli bacterium]
MKHYQPPIFHKIPGYEIVMEFKDEPTHLHGYIAVHSTKRGPALGGTRLWQYPDQQAALTDVLRLARGMTYKAAGADLSLGGGKAVLIGDAKVIKTPALFEAYGYYVNLLKGQYITAEDVNTTTADMVHIAKQTPHVVGREGKSGNPSPFTALGVFIGIQASVAFAMPDKPLANLSFAVQGVGQTGSFIVDQLVKAGVQNITIADINPTHVHTILTRYPFLKVVDQAAIFALPVDVFVPCALGGILNDATLAFMKATIVAGSANNILLDDRIHGPKAKAMGILVAPDFIINAGGLINVYHEYHSDYQLEEVNQEVKRIGQRLTRIYQMAKDQDIDPALAALHYAQQQLK